MINDSQLSNSFIGRVLFTIAILAVFSVALYLLIKIAHILLVLFMGIILAVILDSMMAFVRRLIPMRRPLAFVLVIIVLTGLLFLIGWFIGPRIADRMTILFSETMPQAYDSIRTNISKNSWVNQFLNTIGHGNQLHPPLAAILGGISGIFSTVFSTLISIFIVIFLGAYLAFQPDYYIAKILKIIPIKTREKAEEVIRLSGRALRWWFFGQLLSMLIVGTFMAIGLIIAGIPFPFTLGLLAALLCFIPYIGPIIASLPPVLVTMTVSMEKVAYALIVYLVVQISESYIITPVVQRRAVFIPPAFLFAAQIAMGVIAGAVGVILAAPLAVVFIVFIQKLYIQDILGDTVIILGEHRRH